MLMVSPAPAPLRGPVSETTNTVQEDINSSIAVENAEKVKFIFYPNPTSDVLNIDASLGIQSVEFVNMRGQLVLTSNQKQINISHLPAGTYMVRVLDLQNNVEMKKVVKM